MQYRVQIPSEIRQAMQRQVEAERTKRAEILRSEGVRESAINEAEGQRQARIRLCDSAKYWKFRQRRPV